MEFVNAVLFSAGINIFNISVIGCAVVAAICILFAVIAALIRCQVVYVDPEGDYEIEFEKKKWLSKVVLRPAFKLGKSFVGWSLDPKGENMITEPEFMLTRTYVLYSIWKDETKVARDGEGVFIQLNYLDADGEDAIKSCIYKANAVLPENQEFGVKVNGWAFEKGGKAVLAGENASAVFSINLYPVFDDKATDAAKFDGDVVCELLFIDSNTDAFIYKESHYFDLEVPEAWNMSPSFIGWAVEPKGEAIISRGDDDAVFTIQLFSVDGDVQAVLVDEPYVAPVIEEAPVEESIPEEIVEEEIVEEVIEEPVVEEAIEEPVVEEVVEEPAIEEVVEEPVVEEVIEEPVAEEPVIEEPTEVIPTVIPTYFDNEGNKIDIKYSRSFTANLIQSDDVVKDYYSQLKNHILSYKGVKSKISWKFESFNRGRDQLFKIKFRGKTILLYCALDPEEYDKSKYHHEAIDAKIFAEVPMLLKIKSGLGLRKAKEIVDIVMAKFGIEPNPKSKTVDYVNEYPYEETEALLARKLVKILEADGDVVVVSTKEKEPEVVEPVVEEPVIEEPVIEEPEVVEPVVEEPVVEEPVVEEPVIEEPVVEEPVAEEPVVEEPVVEEPVVEEPVVEEPVIEEPVIEEEEVFEIHEAIVEEVSSEEADQIAEEQHIDATMDEGYDYISAKDTKKVIVNIDSISKAYNAGEIVNMASLKEKKLIVKNAKFVKVLARGTLDKPLKIKAGEFSETAIKMIKLVGGSPTHVKYIIKK